MKNIDNSAMEEDLSTSPSAAMPESPSKTEDEDDDGGMEASDNQILTNDSLEDALNQQLAELEKEEANEMSDAGSNPDDEEVVKEANDVETDGVESTEEDSGDIGRADDAPKVNGTEEAVTEDENVTDDDEDVDKETLSDADKLLEGDDDNAVDGENCSLSDAEKLLDEDETSQPESASKDSFKVEAETETKEAAFEPVDPPKEAAKESSLTEVESEPTADSKTSEANESDTEMKDEAEVEEKKAAPPLDLEEGLNELSRIMQSFKNDDDDPADKEKLGERLII